jgi:hypothetical protein
LFAPRTQTQRQQLDGFFVVRSDEIRVGREERGSGLSRSIKQVFALLKRTRRFGTKKSPIEAESDSGIGLVKILSDLQRGEGGREESEGKGGENEQGRKEGK